MKYIVTATTPYSQYEQPDTCIVSEHRSYEAAEKAMDNIHPLSAATKGKALEIEVRTTKTEAIAYARALVGEIYPFADNYRFNYWPNGLNDFGRESNPTNYSQAMADRSQTLLDIALGYMKKELERYDGGKWTDYL